MRKLTKRDKRTLVIGGVVVVLILLYQFMLPLWEAQAEVSGKLENQQKLLAKTLTALRQDDSYQAELADVERELAAYYQKLLDAPNGAAAVGHLEELVRHLADENDLRVIRSSPLQEQKFGERYLKVGVQFTLEGGIAELTDFLYALSTHPKHLLVEDLFLTNVRDRMQPRLNVSGYIRLS